MSQEPRCSPGQAASQQAPRQGYQDGLGHDHAQHLAGGKSQCLEHPDLGDALPHRHAHGVGGHQQNGENQGAANAEQEHLDVAQHGNEAQLEGPLGLGLGLALRISIEIVDLLRDARHRLGGIGQDAKGSHHPAPGLGQALFQVFPVKIHGEVLVFDIAFKQGPNGQFQVHRVDVPLDRNPLAQLEVQPLGQALADSRGRALRLKGLELFGRHRELLVDLEDPFRIGGEPREEIFRSIVDIDPAEPGGGHQLAHARYLANLLFIVFGKGEGQRDPVAGHKSQGLLGRALLMVEGLIDRKEYSQQKQRNADAGNRQQRSAPVAQRILESQVQGIPKHG